MISNSYIPPMQQEVAKALSEITKEKRNQEFYCALSCDAHTFTSGYVNVQLIIFCSKTSCKIRKEYCGLPD
jgi:hypothetical protein